MTKIKQALNNTGRTFYGSMEVAETSPKTQKGTVEFFKVGKYITEEELETEYQTRGLIPCDLYRLCEYATTNPAFADGKSIATHWKNKDGKWCCAYFFGWLGGRGVSVSLGARDWRDRWWFAGLRKSSTKSLETKTSLDPLTLESAIKLVKKEGYKVIKEM